VLIWIWLSAYVRNLCVDVYLHTFSLIHDIVLTVVFTGHVEGMATGGTYSV